MPLTTKPVRVGRRIGSEGLGPSVQGVALRSAVPAASVCRGEESPLLARLTDGPTMKLEQDSTLCKACRPSGGFRLIFDPQIQCKQIESQETGF